MAPFRHSRRRLQAIVFTIARIEIKSDVWGGSHTGLVPTGQVDLLVPFFVAVSAALATPHFSYLLRLAARALAGPLCFLSSNAIDQYNVALATQCFKAIMGDDAAKQPGSLQEFMLHDTAVSWIRVRLWKSIPNRNWEKMREDYGKRLKRCCDDINEHLDVDGLCHAFPKRIKAVAS